MDSRAPVRHLSRTVCLVAFLLASEASAGIDSPGMVSFRFLAEPGVIYQTVDQVPGDGFSYVRTRAFLSTDASSFERAGVRIWAGFDLAGPDGPRHAMLILDLNLLNPDTMLAEYIETRNDRVLFEGSLQDAGVRILEVWFDDGDAGSVEGEFECIFIDPANPAEGSRVLLAGHFFTEARPPRPASVSDQDKYDEPAGYVETGCGSEVYVDDEYEDSGCGGTDYDDDYDYGGSSDCEGDTYDSGSDSGCEGDTYDSSYSDSSSCESDGYDSYDGSDDSLDCEGDEAYAAVLKPSPKRGRPNPLRAVLRMLPEIAGISYIVFMKRRHRAG